MAPQDMAVMVQVMVGSDEIPFLTCSLFRVPWMDLGSLLWFIIVLKHMGSVSSPIINENPKKHLHHNFAGKMLPKSQQQDSIDVGQVCLYMHFL